MKARKKPIEIEYIVFDGKNDKECRDFVGERFTKNTVTSMTLDEEDTETSRTLYRIETLEGNMEVCKNDIIIKGVNGEFYPCKPDIFNKTYDSID